jgi:tetratricopeptide (TPR) repeat protein
VRMRRRTLCRSKTRFCAGFAVLLMMLPLVAGCATGGKVKPAAIAPEPSVAGGPLVERLEDGRDGFVIAEVPRMDEAARRDFEAAVVLLNEGEYGRAVDLLEKVIEQSPGVTAPYINIAIAYQHIGKQAQAEEHLRTALRLVPEHPVACNEYGLLCRKAGRFDEARAVYEKALSIFPDYYPIRRNLGILCDLYLNDLPCALEHYEIYSEAMPEDKQVRLWISDLRSRLGIER